MSISRSSRCLAIIKIQLLLRNCYFYPINLEWKTLILAIPIPFPSTCRGNYAAHGTPGRPQRQSSSLGSLFFGRLCGLEAPIEQKIVDNL